MSETLLVACRLTTPSGWLDVNSGIYRVAASSFAEQAITWRRTQVTNQFVEGSWTVNALRENVTENLDIWVRGEDTRQMQQGVDDLVAVVSQLNYGLEVTFDNVKSYYICNTADISVKIQQEFRFARMAMVSAQIPRDPNVRREVVD